MFERRLKVVLTIPVLCGTIMLARLYRLQIGEGGAYQQSAEAALIAPRHYLPPLRGAIRDRTGEVLVSDEPAFDLTVLFGALKATDRFVADYALDIRRSEPEWRDATPEQLKVEATERLDGFYDRLARLSDTPVDDLLLRRDQIVASVDGLAAYIRNARIAQGMSEKQADVRLREEDLHHPLMRDVPAAARSRIEMELQDLPFVRIEPSVRRVWHPQAKPLCHLLGRIGQVSAERIESDPLHEDALSRYRAGDMAGVSGVELLAELRLRGTRGYEERDLDGNVLEHREPIDGRDVRLTIDLALQDEIARILMDAVTAEPYSTGASCVVIDVPSGDVLALVSVPTYDLETVREHYDQLRDDTRFRPLLFRAVAEEYQPGSIMKPVALLAGFRYGVVDPQQSYVCNGSFIDGSDNWHCWTYWKQLPGHGPVNAEEAIQHSCNVYFYGLGQRLNPHRLTSFYSDFILGPDRPADDAFGLGLIEGRDGIIPTQEWIQANRGRGYSLADGRNYAIGQGELQITPLQAANMYATLARGAFLDPNILLDPALHAARDIPGLRTRAWNTARRGLYRCVNEEGGTAQRTAKMDEIVVCGKTGSAQCVARALRTEYTFADAHGNVEKIIAPTIEAAREAMAGDPDANCIKRKIVERWPPKRPEEKTASPHAWFAAFAPYKKPRIALALVIEHGGSGGHVAAPIGKRILEAILASPHDYLSPSKIDHDALAQRDQERP